MKPGDEVIIRCRLVEDFGDDVTVRVEAPRGSTVVQVAKRNIEDLGLYQAASRGPRSQAR